ncbi:hypothetical protein [Streptosporangium sp. NPDC000396]|uniref:hypothetical protein n=1 Tax=Streptosporangium sp. NPDC000396 TaxID=3366185 RepID=UPI0036AEC1A3
MSPAASLNPKIVGQAENAHEAVLARALATTGVTKKQWIGLTLAATAETPLGTEELARHLAGALRTDPASAHQVLSDLVAAGLLAAEHAVTPTGREFFERVRAETGQVIARAYDGIPAEDLGTAARVLELITGRLDHEAARTAS